VATGPCPVKAERRWAVNGEAQITAWPPAFRRISPAGIYRNGHRRENTHHPKCAVPARIDFSIRSDGGAKGSHGLECSVAVFLISITNSRTHDYCWSGLQL